MEIPKDVIVASDGKPVSTIVIPFNAPPPVAFAAEELKGYLDRMTGADFEIVNEIPETGPAIILGENHASLAGIETESLARDGYVIQTLGDKLYVAGRDDSSGKSALLFMLKDESMGKTVEESWQNRQENFSNTSWDFERATLYGVYDLLERMGVRWFFPGPKGEVVPTRADIAIAPIDIREEPCFILRRDGGILFDATFLNRKHLDREEYDYLGWNPQNQKLWLLRSRESSFWMPLNHRPARQDWSRRFGESNPEYFALMADGSRATGTSGRDHGYLNYTSEGMLNETMKDMDAFFSGESPESRGMRSMRSPSIVNYNNGWEPNVAYGDYFSLLPNDGLRVDRSPESLKYIHEDKPLFFRHTNYIWQFVNEAATRLKAIHPDRFITCIAYQSYAELPDPELIDKLPDNVVVGVAALSGCSRINNFMVEKSRMEYLNLLQRWSEMSDAPMVFWTYWLYRHGQADRKGVPLLLPHGAQEFVQGHAPYGKYWFMEHDNENLTYELLNRYVMFRLLWNPDADIDSLIDDYCNNFFGPASEAMKEMLLSIEEISEKNASTNADMIAIWETGFTPEIMKQYRQQINRAKALCLGTDYLGSVELMDRYFISAMEHARETHYETIRVLRSQDKDRVTAYQAPATAIVIDGEYDHAWRSIGGRAFYNNVNGRVAGGLGKGIYPSHRIRYSDDTLYFFFDIPFREDGLNESDIQNYYLEIFLDDVQNDESYYWLQILPDGSYVEKSFPSVGEPPFDWESNVDVKMTGSADGWLVEVALPLDSIALDGVNLEEMEFRLLLGLTDLARRDEGRFASSNQILRGAFHQPGMFNRMRFSPMR